LAAPTFRGALESRRLRPANQACPGIDVQFVAGNKRSRPELPAFDQPSVSDLDLRNDELINVLMDVLLYRIAPINPRADLTKHFVPGSSDLGAQVAPQRREILVEFPIAIPYAHPQMRRPIQPVTQAQSARIEVF